MIREINALSLIYGLEVDRIRSAAKSFWSDTCAAGLNRTNCSKSCCASASSPIRSLRPPHVAVSGETQWKRSYEPSWRQSLQPQRQADQFRVTVNARGMIRLMIEDITIGKSKRDPAQHSLLRRQVENIGAAALFASGHYLLRRVSVGLNIWTADATSINQIGGCHTRTAKGVVGL